MFFINIIQPYISKQISVGNDIFLHIFIKHLNSTLLPFYIILLIVKSIFIKKKKLQ